MLTEGAALEKLPSKDMIIFGGVHIAQDFVRLGLVDVYDLVLNPVILRPGTAAVYRRLPPAGPELLSCQAFEGKAVALRDERAAKEPAGG